MTRVTGALAAALVLSIPMLSSAATVRVATTEGAADATVEVPVEVGGISGLKAFRVEIRYDAAVLTPQKVEADARMAGALFASNLDESGRVKFNGASLEAIAGEGALARVRFKVIGRGGQVSALTPEHCRVWDGKGTELFVSVTPGQVKVVSAIPWLWIGVGVGAFLLLMVVGRLVSRGKRVAPAPAPAPPAAVAPRAAPTPPPAADPSTAVSCAKCGTEVKPGAKFCGKCGAPRGGPRACAKCGAAVSPDVRFCEQCGAAC